MKIVDRKKIEIASNVFLALILSCVIYSGFAYPLTYGVGFWPFNRDWFMFSYDTGDDFDLQAWTEGADGKPVQLDVSDLFQFSLGNSGNRFQEVPRDQESMERLARFLCAHYSIEKVSLQDLQWHRNFGKRKKSSEIPASRITTTTWIKQHACN